MAKDFTVAQLEKILVRKKGTLEKLMRQRSQLQKKLAQVERRIVEIGGSVRERGKPRPPRRRPKNPKTLLAAVSEILAQHKKGLTLRDLANKLLQSGYKTSSTNFPNTLYQCLYHNSDKLVHDAKTHTYRIRKAG
ncbi:MAG: HTH domain-containing protein [Deltaproteobacteria bacterium]